MGLFNSGPPEMEDRKCPNCKVLMSTKIDIVDAKEGARIPGLAIMGPIVPKIKTYYKLTWSCPKCGYTKEELKKK